MPRPIPPPLLAAAAAAPDAATDAELLRRYVRDGDGSAFELVLRRHAATVWTACRRILSEADAEDAFQAAFLVLVRKAGAVRGASAGGWLHRVAVTAALKRKARGRAFAGAVEAATTAPDPLERAELAAAVHEELARLPDRYRLPVVLCDLEGETQPAAAARLGWPVGSVAGRLSRARALLRDRLTRRGFAPTGSVLVLPLVGVPGRVVTAAVAAATGAAAPPLPVSILATGVLSAMRTAKLKLAATVVAVASVIGAAGFGAYTAVAQPLPPPREAGKAEPPPPAPPVPAVDWLQKGSTTPSAFPDIQAPQVSSPSVDIYPMLFGEKSVEIAAGDDTYRRLLKARLLRQQQFQMRSMVRFRIGQFQSADFFAFLHSLEDVRVVAAELWRGDARTLDAWLLDLLRVAKWFEQYSVSRVDAGTDPPHVLDAIIAHRLGVEAALWKHRNPGR